MSRFLYVTYIRTTQQKLWDALLKPEFTKAYWFGVTQDSSWKKGASWALVSAEGKTMDEGEVLEIEPPKKLVLKWQHTPLHPELHDEGASRATFELVAMGDTIRLTVIHEIDRTPSKLIDAVSDGWPAILASLKSLLETGKPLERPSNLEAKRG